MDDSQIGRTPARILTSMSRRGALRRLGATVTTRPAPAQAELADSDYGAIFSTDLSRYHQRFADRAALYRPLTARLVAHSADAAGIGYADALRARDRVTAAWTRWFAEHGVDLLLEIGRAHV